MAGSVDEYEKDDLNSNDKEEEQASTILKNEIETIVDVHEVVIGDTALLEPDKIAPLLRCLHFRP